MTIKSLVFIAALVLSYVSMAWLWFGAIHPCEILIVRQKQHHIELAKKHTMEDLEDLKTIARKTLPPKDYDRFVSHLGEYSDVTAHEYDVTHAAVLDLRRKISRMTPAQCAWQAATWRAPKGPSAPSPDNSTQVSN